MVDQEFLPEDVPEQKEIRHLLNADGVIVNLISYDPDLPEEMQYVPPEGYTLSDPIELSVESEEGGE